MPRVTLICEACGTPYQRWPSKATRGSRFCSRACRATGLSRVEYLQQYRETNRACLREQNRQRMQDPARQQAQRERGRQTALRLKHEVLKAYGGYVCTCDHGGAPCGPQPFEFLAIDHINGNDKHPGEKGGYRFYRRLKREGFPAGYRVLCHNCNCSLGFYGRCPHSVTETQPIKRRKDV